MKASSPLGSQPLPGPLSPVRGQWRLWAVVLCLGLPPLGVGLAGVLWLIDRHVFGWACLALMAGQAIGFTLLRRWSRGESGLLPSPSQGLPSQFSVRDEEAWALVREYQARIDRHEIACARLDQFVDLGREILDRVARHYRPEESDPVLAVQVPLLFRAIEETARDMAAVTANVPFSHRITISDIVRAHRLGKKLEPAHKLYRLYRLLSPLLNWQTGLFRLLVRDRMFNLTKETLNDWMLKWYVDRVGYHAIELYSGKLLLSGRQDMDDGPAVSPEAEEDLTAAEAEKAPSEPLRLLILGQVKAGKSSLLNALFGTLRAQADVLPATGRVTRYVLERPDMGGRILLSDMAGYEDPGAARDRVAEALAEGLKSDLIVLVASAVNAARDADRRLLTELRERFSSHPELSPAPVIAAITHIDLLRPVRDWAPPYDIVSPGSPKAESIRGAVDAAALDLGLPSSRVIPVCLASDRLYNVEEALVPCLIHLLPEAKRSLFLRGLKALRDREQWDLICRQARAAGRFLWEIGGEILKST